nr:MAG: Prophage endopeptidase tail [Bacteriophage sp.]
MKIQLYNRAQAKAYTIHVGSGSTYTWKKQEEEFITVNFSSDSVLALKKGFYTNIESLGRFEVVNLPTPTKASKDIGYDYELRLDRPWYKFKNRIIFFRRGSVNGKEAKWSLTDTLQAHAGILTDNLANIGYTYAGKEYLVYIHDDVEKRNEAKLIAYDSTTLLSALDKIAEAFDTEWWITENTIHFGRCEQGEQTITLEHGKELNGLSRSEDSEEHGTRLYAFGSSRNLNQNYRRKLKNPFTIDGFHTLYGTKVRFTTNKPKNFFSEKKRIKITSYSKYEGQTFTFKVVSGSYTNPAAGQTVSWNNPVFEIEVGSMVDAIGFQNGTGVQFIIGDETGGQTEDSKTTMVKIERDSYPIFSFKELQLQKKAITPSTRVTLADKTETGIEFIGITSDGTSSVNDGRDCYALTDKTKQLAGSSQQVTLSHLAMAYVSKLYTEPIDGQSEVAIQGVSDTILQLPIGTPYIDSDKNLDPDDITDIVKTYEDIYPRALLTITEVTEIAAKTTDTDTGNVTYWTAYRFKAKLQDGSPFVFDSIYETQEDNKPLSIHFESGKLNGMDFEVHFNPDADTDDKQLFEITRNDTYTLELPNETMKPAVGDTLYMYNMDITFIDDELVEAAEMELKAEAEKDMKKMKVDSGTYTGTKNPVLFGQKGIELTYGSKVKLVAPEYFDKEDHARESRIIGWELDLEDLTQGELTIGESKTGSRSDTLAETVSQIVYKNEQIQNQQELQLSKIRNLIDTIVGKRFLSKLVDDTAEGIITFLQGIKLGKGGEYSIEGNGKASLREVFANAIKAAKTISVGNNFYFDADGEFKFDKDGNIIANSVTAGKLASKDFNENERKGFVIAAKDKEKGTYKLCIDEIIAWAMATVGALHVKGASTFDGDLFSKEFISGFLGGKGWGIYNKPITNAAGMQENKWTGEFDNLIVRGSLRVYEMIISQLLGENDNRIFTGMMEVDHYDAETGIVYLDTQDGKLYNPFRKDDCIMVQQYNGMPNSSNDYYVTKSYELIITEAGCGSTADGENRLDWVKFKNFTSSVAEATPANFIKKNDTFVRVDNLSDPGRKGIMQIITVGTAAPYLDILYGLKTDPDNSLKGRLGNLQGIHHRTFGDLDGFGELLQNLYATGDMILRRTGESVDTKFQMLKNQFATRFAQTTYELTNEDNYIHNGTFLAAIGATEDSLTIDGWSIDDSDETAIWILNGAPVMVNGQITTSGNRRILIEETEGRNMLRIINCGLTQANALIRQPGTHKEYTKPSETKNEDEMGTTGDGFTEVQDTLYINARVYAKTAGTMTIGFSPATEVGGKKNELAAQSIKIAYSGEWQFVKLEGKWNGKGNFVLRYTGDMLVSFLAVTDKPIDNLQKTVSTQIIQTATNIKLLGENIDKVNGKTTQLGIELDAEKEAIRLYVDTKDEALKTDYTSQISITKENILLEVTEKNNALNEELSSKINTEAGRIDLINSRQTDTESMISSIETSIKSIKLEVSDVKDTADKTSAALARLTITVDGISTAVGKAATKDELEANVKTLNDTMSNLRTGEYYEQEANPWNKWTGGSEYKHNGAIWKYTGENNGWLIKGHIYRYKCYSDGSKNSKDAWEDVTKIENATTTVIQKADSWTETAGRFNASGQLVNTSYLMTTADKNQLVSTYFNNDGSLKNTAGLVTTSAYAGLFLDAIQDNGVMTSADMSLYVTKDSGGYITNAKIKADRIILEGAITANGTFRIDTSGSMQASAGQIAGMKIKGECLTNEGFDNDAYIVLRNDTHKVFAGIGGNVLPASTGARAVARFTNEESSKFFGDVNYSIVCGAKGAVTNVALDMTLGGYITGLRIKNARLSSGGSSYRSPVAIPKGTTSVILGGSGYYQLPQMNKEDDGYVVFIRNDYDGAVHLRSNTSITSKGQTRTSFILYDRGSNTTDLTIESRGDSMILVYHRDVNIAGEENTKVGCWTQYKCPRDW